MSLFLIISIFSLASRYEGASFGHENPYAPFPMKASNPYAEVFRGLAVRDAAKAWHNNKGYHALPIALNILNNALLRSHLNSSQNPLEYGQIKIAIECKVLFL